MQQLAFPFMVERYDITTDSKIPITQEYVDTLEEVQQAYGRVRLAIQQHHDGVISIDELDAIHSDLRKRISVPT